MNQEKIIQAIAEYLEKMITPHYDGITSDMVGSPTCDVFCQEIARELAAAVAPHMEAGAVFYDPSEYPTRVEGEDFSVDVFILDETGVHGIAFWNFDDEVWRFHTDTLVDYNEKGAETKWKWYYPPFGLDQVFKAK